MHTIPCFNLLKIHSRTIILRRASSPTFPSQLTDELELRAVLEDILDVHHLNLGTPEQLHVLVKWKNLSAF